MRHFMLTALALWLGLLTGLPPATAQNSTSSEPVMQPVIFVPYEDLHGPELDLGQSVLLPYAEFLKLRETIPREGHVIKPAAALAQAQYSGRLLDDVVVLTGRLTVETIAEAGDQLSLSFPFQGVAIESIQVEGGTAAVMPLSQGEGFGLRLIGPGTREVEVRLAVPVRPANSSQHITFDIPRSPAGLLEIEVPEDVELAANDASIAARIETDRVNDVQRNLIKASIGARDRVRIDWKTRVVRTGEAAKTRIAATHFISLNVTENSALVRDNLTLECLSGRMSQIGLQIPENTRLINIAGAHVKDWGEPGADRIVPITLALATDETISLSIDLEYDTIESESAPLEFAGLHVEDAVRESGSILIHHSPRMSIWPEVREGLADMVLTNANTGAQRAFQFAQAGWRLQIARRIQLARVRAEGLQLYEATRQYTRIKTRHALNISGRSIFSVRFEIPEGFEIAEAGPEALVAARRQDGRSVELTFKGEQLGRCVIDMMLQRAEQSENRTIELRPVRVLETEEDGGTIILATPTAIKTTELSASGFEATDVRPFLNQLRGIVSTEVSPSLGYRYFTGNELATASLERQRTRTTCETALLATIEPTLMRMNATFNFNVEFSPSDTFELMLPVYAGDDVVFNGADIKEKNRSTAVDEDGLTTWTVKLQRRVLGNYPLHVSFDREIATAEMGEATSVTVPVIHAANVARETGAIAISRGENLEVRVAVASGLEARDIKELPAQLARGYIGFRYFDATQIRLELTLIRHELEAVLGALVRRLHIDTIVSDQREVVHEVWLEVQNNREQYLELKLPAGMQIWSAFVRGKPVRSTTRQSDQARLIELEKSETLESAFRVRLILRQTLPGGELGARGRLNFEPVEPLNMPVLRTSWKLFLPRGYRYVEFGGSMNLETGGHMPWIEPNAEYLLNDLPASIAGGIAGPALNPPVTNASANYEAEESEVEKQARLQGVALEIPIVREGLQYQFSKLSGVGDIEVKYWKRKPLVLLQILIALLVFGGMLGVALWRRHPAMPIGLTVFFFLGASLCGGMAGRLFATSMTASLVALALILGAHLIRKNRQQPESMDR